MDLTSKASLKKSFNKPQTTKNRLKTTTKSAIGDQTSKENSVSRTTIPSNTSNCFLESIIALNNQKDILLAANQKKSSQNVTNYEKYL